jgi:16S rRNA (cytosine967-C5)-methyltransferase
VRENRYAGSKDRAAIADIVYDCLRKRRSLAAQGGGETGRALVAAHVVAEGGDVDALFSGDRFSPAPLTEAERAALAAEPSMTDAERLDVPDWLEAPLRASLGADFEPALRALRERAPLDLRVNSLKAEVSDARAALAAEGVEAEPGPFSPWCLRVAEGARRVATSSAYRDGLVEIQDAASQAVARLAGAAPMMTVVDICAGGGGKSLALAAEMQGVGRLVAHDVAPQRLRDLPERAERAGVIPQIVATGELSALEGQADVVLVDAPCSGSGAWRRNPDSKWRLTPERLNALVRAQAEALDMAAPLVKPGGRLIYATCSILRRENEDAATDFLARRSAFEAAPIGPLEGAVTADPGLRLHPATDLGDGFYVAAFRNRA